MFRSIGLPEILLILVLALLVVGPRRLPEVGKALGKSISEFKGAVKKAEDSIKEELQEDPPEEK